MQVMQEIRNELKANPDKYADGRDTIISIVEQGEFICNSLGIPAGAGTVIPNVTAETMGTVSPDATTEATITSIPEGTATAAP
jgi:hypothetical protein